MYSKLTELVFSNKNLNKWQALVDDLSLQAIVVVGIHIYAYQVCVFVPKQRMFRYIWYIFLNNDLKFELYYCRITNNC